MGNSAWTNTRRSDGTPQTGLDGPLTTTALFYPLSTSPMSDPKGKINVKRPLQTSFLFDIFFPRPRAIHYTQRVQSPQPFSLPSSKSKIHAPATPIRSTPKKGAYLSFQPMAVLDIAGRRFPMIPPPTNSKDRQVRIMPSCEHLSLPMMSRRRIG